MKKPYTTHVRVSDVTAFRIRVCQRLKDRSSRLHRTESALGKWTQTDIVALAVGRLLDDLAPATRPRK